MNYDNCDGMTYTIKQGDTLYGISRKYDVPLAMILHANPYADVYRLNIGDTICIPVRKKCCGNAAADGSGGERERKAGYSMENNISGSINVSGNTTEMFKNINVSGNTTDMSNDTRISDGTAGTERDNDNIKNGDVSARISRNDDMPGDKMSYVNDNMDLPDKEDQKMSGGGSLADMMEHKVSEDDNWVKYVAQPGDTLFDVFNRSDCDLNEFLNKNGLKGIYILPGLVYFVKEK